MAVPTQTQRLKLVLLPGIDGTGELFAEFVAALAGEFEIAIARYPTEQCLSYSEIDGLVRAAVSSVKPKVLAARLRGVLAAEARPEMDQVTAPILYLQAKQDRLVGASCLDELRRIKSQMTVAVLEGPHLLVQREPYKAAETVAGFLRSLWQG